VVVQVRDGGQCRADQVRRVALVVAALAAYAVKQLAAQRQVGDEIYLCGKEMEGKEQDFPRHFA
jgi:hypothetical protein